jgi:ribosomal protein S18 acetylase RimI-like enzyme
MPRISGAFPFARVLKGEKAAKQATVSLPMENVLVRKYRVADRSAVRRISCQTAFLEFPRSQVFTDDEILADVLTSYFTDYEPESCFVAESGGNIIGYIIGARDVRVLRKIYFGKIVPRLVGKMLLRGVLLKRENIRLGYHSLLGLFKGEFSVPDFSLEYPATLHINIDQGFRGQSLGTQLLTKYLQYLQDQHVAGLHFSTSSAGAKNFFLKNGFAVFFQQKRSYLQYVLGQALTYYVFGKKF